MVTWTEDKIEAVYRLWKQGKSARQIAKLLPGNFSRSAICGMIFRHNFTREPGDPRPAQPKPPASGRKPGKKNGAIGIVQLKPQPSSALPPLFAIGGKPPIPAIDIEQVADERAGRAVGAWRGDGPRLLATLGAFDCRYIVAGEGRNAVFCAERVLPGRPYCAAHRACCYQKATAPRKVRRGDGAGGDRSRRPTSFHFGRTEDQHF